MLPEIFGPMLGMMLLTVCVWFFMFAKRIPFINSLDMENDALTGAELTRLSPISVSNPSDNLKNLFEMPVLFYGLCIYLFVMGQVDDYYIWAAWAFFVFRALHSIVHCVTTKVMLRFMLYAVSCLSLFLMVIRAALAHFL